MIVSNVINKIFNEYQNINLTVNSCLKYSFTYNGYKTDVFYTEMDGLQNQILICINIDNIDYISTLNFGLNKDNEYSRNFYLPIELYNKVQFNLLYVDGKCSTTPYFETMVNEIMNNAAIPSNHRDELGRKKIYKYNANESAPYFETIIRKKMSYKMKQKICKKYDSELSNKILEFCGSTHTLRFTNEINKSKDISVLIN